MSMKQLSAMTIGVILISLGALLFGALAQVMTVATNGTITVTNTFQLALAPANGGRLGCTVQNQGTHTMYVFPGAGTASEAKSLQLTAGAQMTCGLAGSSQNINAIMQDELQITGTSGDAFMVWAQ